jgi:hypothetical protein
VKKCANRLYKQVRGLLPRGIYPPSVQKRQKSFAQQLK